MSADETRRNRPKFMTLKDFHTTLNALIQNEIPPELLSNLSGGIIVKNQLQQDDDEKNYYILGEYVEDELGSYIVLYYGSFNYFYGDKSDNHYRKKILSTIKHELTHHIESLCGHEYLAYEEDLELAKRKGKYPKI